MVFVVLGDLNIGVAVRLKLLLDLGIGHLVGGEYRSRQTCQQKHPERSCRKFHFNSSIKQASAGGGSRASYRLCGLRQY
jgi:hypothetical protein